MKRILSSILFLGLAACSHAESEKPVPINNIPSVTNASGQKFYLGLTIPKGFKPENVKSVYRIGEELPTTFDWRQKVQLSPIENQGSCGSCWAFSTAATFQDVLRIKGVSIDLSEQHLLSCAKPGEWSCNGGFFAHDRHKAPFGGVLASEYPYTASDTTCKSGLIFRNKISSWAYLPGGDNAGQNVNDIKAAIMKYGPISVGVAVDDAFSNYSGGIFRDTGYRQLNHAVNLVGWGDGYWIMRNSWGSSWGEQGYMRLAFGANGIGAWPNYVVYEGDNPGPNPNPDPTPTPEPDCKPQPIADTGFGDTINVGYGQTVIVGTKQRPGHKYYWTAEPAFDNNAVPKTAQIRYSPRITKRLTVHAITNCGEKTDSVTINMLSVKNPPLRIFKELH